MENSQQNSNLDSSMSQNSSSANRNNNLHHLHQQSGAQRASQTNSDTSAVKQGSICSKCSYWRIHKNITIEHDHRSCICILLIDNSICCASGYENLVHNIPGLIFWSPIPTKFSFDDFMAHLNPRTQIYLCPRRTELFNRAVTRIRSNVFANWPIIVNSAIPVQVDPNCCKDGRCNFSPPS